MKNFALVSAAGFVAPRHMKAIKESGNDLVAAFDPNDSVGTIDAYFPKASFFVEFERFDRHLDKLRRAGKGIDFLTVCSPNYLHDSHIRFGLRSQAHIICEKPLVLNPWNLDALAQIEKESDQNIYTILQLRLHPSIIALREKIKNGPADKIYDVDLTYITARGNWYYTSWKGDVAKSGGIATNIGVHFFDMLAWIFGDLQSQKVHLHTHDRAAGFITFKRARVRWFLSINANTLPEGQENTCRSLEIDGEKIDFTNGFTDLHTASYSQILSGKGFGVADAKPSIELVHEIRHAAPVGLSGDYHPLAKLPLAKHPFLKL